jgi:hypothetical protein
MESYKDDYPSHAKGIVQEAVQNAVDARLDDLGFKKVVITIEYNPESRILRIRDYGTTGMSHCSKCDWGYRNDTNEDCHEKDCKWGNFHYLGGIAKDLKHLGSRGQGKSLLIVAGDHLVVRTKVATSDGSHVAMGSIWTREGEDWYWEKASGEALKPTESPGTEFVCYGVIDKVHDQLLDAEDIKNDVSITWFKAIEKGVTIRFGYTGKELMKVGSPHFPPTQMNDEGKPIVRHRASIPVSYNRKTVGDLVDVELRLAADPVPSELQGIALVKNGTQAIERITKWGRKIRQELQDRLYGWAMYYCTEDRPFLQVCEKPGHRGFNLHQYYGKTMDLLQQQVEDFLMPYEKQLIKPRLMEKDRKRAQQNLEVIQKALEAIPEFNPWSGEKTLPRKRTVRPPPDHPYISSISFDKESYKRGEHAATEIVLLNPTREYQPFVHLTVEALDEGLNRLAIWEFPPEQLPLLGPSSDEEKGRIKKEFDIAISEDFGAGRNWVRCTLLERKPMTPTNGNADTVVENLLDRESHSLWIEVEPTKIARGPPTGGSSGEGGKPGNIQKVVPVSDESLDPVAHEVMPMWQAAEIWFFTKGARMRYVYESDPRTADSVFYEIVSEAIAERIARTSIESDVRDRLDKSQVLDEMKRLEELRKRFLRTCEQYRSSKQA